VCFASLLGLPPADAQTVSESRTTSAAGYARAATLGEVAGRWQPQVHLYVIGDIGLAEDALQDLGAWLGNTHWTVLLIQGAAGHAYTDLYGEKRFAEDAIEYCTVKGIPKRIGFAAQVHPRTQEPDGAVFTIVLAERALFYAGSRAQNRRGLGEPQFKGKLDRWAIEALRSDGGVAGAVRDTVSQISAELEASIAQDFASPKDWIGAATARLNAMERLSRELRLRSPHAFRKLRLPDLAELRGEVDAAWQARDAGRIPEAATRLTKVLDQSSSAIEALESLRRSVLTVHSELQRATAAIDGLEAAAAGLRKAFPTLQGPLVRPGVPKLLQELASAKAALKDDPARTAFTATWVAGEALARTKAIAEYPAAGEALKAAEGRLAHLERRQRAAAARGPLLAARQHLRAARRLYDRGAPDYAERLDAAKRALTRAQGMIANADALAAAIRFLFLLLLAALAAVGVALNRRRRGVKQLAEQLLADRRAVLDPKLAALLDELQLRVALFVGAASGEDKPPYTGETLRLAERIRGEVGSLHILWSSASGVLQRAEALVHGRWLGAVYNFFLPGRYRRSIALLADEPVQKIADELNLSAGRAAEALDLVEWSVRHGPATLEETGKRIRSTEARKNVIEFAGFADDLFLVPALFTLALPAASAALRRARARFPIDPVGALQDDGATAQRIALEASQLAEIIAASRDGVLPAVEAGAAMLRQANIATDWIEAERLRLSAQADLLASQAAEVSVAGSLEDLARCLADLGAQVASAVHGCREASSSSSGKSGW